MSQSSHREEEDRIPAHVEILSDATSVSSSHHPHPRRDSSLQYSASARGSAIENIYNAYKSHDNYRTKQLGHAKRELWLWDTLAIRGMYIRYNMKHVAAFSIHYPVRTKSIILTLISALFLTRRIPTQYLTPGASEAGYLYAYLHDEAECLVSFMSTVSLNETFSFAVEILSVF